MALMHVNIVIIGIAIFLALMLILIIVNAIKKKDKFNQGTRAANTTRIKKTGLYRQLNVGYIILSVLAFIGFAGSVIFSLILAARPVKTEDVTAEVRQRDIILCMDVSFSLYDLNTQITNSIKEMLGQLDGDRIGINIFNSSSVTYVPLTDDYDYLSEKLDDLNRYFADQKEYMEVYVPMYEHSNIPADRQEACEELEDRLLYFDSGTRFNSEKGSSLIGEGLATALYSFPYLGETDRTRVIIMCTDNELKAYQEEIVNLSKAADYCKKYDVTVFGIFPSEENFYKEDGDDFSTCLAGLTEATEKTGGLCFTNDEQTTSGIVEEIRKHKALAAKTVTTQRTVDLPEIPFIALMICLTVGCLTGVVMQK